MRLMKHVTKTNYMTQTIVNHVLFTAFIVISTLQAHKVALKNNWTFWDWVRNKKYNLLIAALFIAVNIGYGIYRYKHLA